MRKRAKNMKNILSKFAVFILLIASIQTTSAQSKATLGTGKTWMLTYFRQRYPTRIEINAKGETVEVPCPTLCW